MSSAKHHAEWLSLIEVSGPFLSMPVLTRIFPQGLDLVEAEKKRLLREGYEEWEANCELPNPNPAIHREWVKFVLDEVLDFDSNCLVEGSGMPPGASAEVAEFHEVLKPDMALINPAGGMEANRFRMFVQIYPHDQNLERQVRGKSWSVSPCSRMTELLRRCDVKLGMVTNGENWVLIYVPQGETTSYITFTASLWLEEELTLRAFVTLLSRSRFINAPENETLEGMLEQSASDQHEVTDQLGLQVRRAVETLIRSLDTIDLDSNGQALAGIDEKTIYDSALTVMMRLVFLFCAEERGLLLLGDPVYDQHYAVSTLRDLLRQDADRHGEEVLERRSDAFGRLLATFRAVHGGIDYEQMRLPAYGGSLFDPDRFPFLEGRQAGTSWKTTPANPLAVDNRTTLHLLEALQILQTRVPGSNTTEARRLSFRALDIEQIGHVYEGLLDHTAKRVPKNRPVVALAGTSSKEQEIELVELEAKREAGETELIDFLSAQTGKTKNAIKNELNRQIEPERINKLSNACGNDKGLLERVKPFGNLVRDDSFGRPLIISPGRVYVTAGEDRRSSGAHYTPRSLTESIVQHTLEPLVFYGPAEGLQKSEWRLKSPAEIIGLKILDMAMGSGAFLVQTCRWLSERLVESWENVASGLPENVRITPLGEPSEGLPEELIIPKDPDERMAYARRIICDRCLYGVDKNPMAVDMAKLSLWLVTLDKGRAFTFLDHALKCGDSLLGLSSKDQVIKFHVTPEKVREIQVNPVTSDLVPRMFRNSVQIRRELESFVVKSVADSEKKAYLLAQADTQLLAVRSMCDMLIASAFKTADGNALKRNGAPPPQFETQRSEMWAQIVDKYDASGMENVNQTFTELSREARAEINISLADRSYMRIPFHWPVEFPEVFAANHGSTAGFSAIVGNPPFMGGQKITGQLGEDYRNYLVDMLASGKKGSADLCAYFFLRANQLVHHDAMLGLLATNTIAQGDSREVGLDQLAEKGLQIPRAVASRKWPGTANLEVSHVWLRKGSWKGPVILDEKPVRAISPLLQVPGRVSGNPYRLTENANKSFQGSIILGLGFTMSPDEAEEHILRNPVNKRVLYPYLNGEDLNSRPDQSPSRWVINFHDWPLRRAESREWKQAGDKGQKELRRNGIVETDYNGDVAADFPEILKIVESRVKPERTRKKQDGSFAMRYPLYLRWWQYERRRPELYSTISGMERVLVRARHTNLTWMPVTSSDSVFSEALVVFAIPYLSGLAIMSSIFHVEWFLQNSSTIGAGVRYSPTDCFETFSFPKETDGFESMGYQYLQLRSSIMLERNEGLTALFNRFNNKTDGSGDISNLRDFQREMDHAVAAAYGWTDLELGHGFYETKQGIRYTVHEAARVEILDRLLELNHQRHDEEEKKGLVEGGKAKPKTKAKKAGDKKTLSLDFG